jgi:hypothetical protein
MMRTSDIGKEVILMVEIKSIEDAKEAGLNTSGYELIKDRWWLSAGDAATLISLVNNHPVDTKYLNNPIKQGRLHPKRFSPKCNMYPFDELVKIEVKNAGRPQLADDKVTASAIRQRKFKAKKRAERLAQKEEASI